jgi:hypothetical protein
MASSKFLDSVGLTYLWEKIKALVAKTTARADGKYLYNGQTVDAEIAGVGLSTSNNLLNNGKNVALRASSTNPFLGLKEGSNLWYAQAASGYFYFGPTSTKALRLDQAGNGVFQTGSVTATSIIKSGGTSSQFLKADGSVDSNTYLTTAPVTSVNGQTGTITVKENVQADWNATSGDAVILNKPNIYNNNGELNIKPYTNSGDIRIATDYHPGEQAGEVIISSADLLRLSGVHGIYINGAISVFYESGSSIAYYNNKEIATVDQLPASITNMEIDAKWDKVMTGLIEFKATQGRSDSVLKTFFAVEGMTWQEWVNSEYNTDNYTIIGNHVCASGDNYVATQEGSPDYMVLSSDVIIANKEYTTFFND